MSNRTAGVGMLARVPRLSPVKRGFHPTDARERGPWGKSDAVAPPSVAGRQDRNREGTLNHVPEGRIDSAAGGFRFVTIADDYFIQRIRVRHGLGRSVDVQ